MADKPAEPRAQRLRSLGRGFWLLVELAFRADPWRAAVMLVPVGALVAIGTAIATRGLVDAVAGGERAEAWTWITVIAGSGVVIVVLILGQFAIDMRLRERLSLEVDQRLIDLCSGIPTIEHLERPEYADRIELLRTNRYALMSGVSSVAYGISTTAELVMTVGVLVWIHPATLVAVLLAIPAVALAMTSQSRVEKVQEETTEDERKALHLFDLAAADDAAKELRVFGLQGEFRRRYDDLWRGVERKRTRANAIASAQRAAGFTLFVSGFVAALAVVADAAAAGDATVGDLYLAVLLTGRLTGQLQAVAGQAMWFTTTLRNAARFLWIVDYAEEARSAVRSTGAGSAEPPSSLREGIRLEGVTFRYGDDDRPALADVDLHLPAGATVAVVGDNGAGKTTLVKLLSALYRPTEGRVVVDGVDLARIDPLEWRQRMSAGFQDHVKFELVAHETVGVGHMERLGDIAAADAALDRAAGRDVLAALADGWDTPLGSTLDGADLSGGQWQKLSLGRAMMRDRPLLLVLDEPTSALDAETEFALFERYAEAARSAAANAGTITLLVSHRFSTVRMADLIVVIADGRVAEVGSHAELVAGAGLYAELYELQASSYR